MGRDDAIQIRHVPLRRSLGVNRHQEGLQVKNVAGVFYVLPSLARWQVRVRLTTTILVEEARVESGSSWSS
jgi:hypothetical protein